jgi:hypothetical protein
MFLPLPRAADAAAGTESRNTVPTVVQRVSVPHGRFCLFLFPFPFPISTRSVLAYLYHLPRPIVPLLSLVELRLVFHDLRY